MQLYISPAIIHTKPPRICEKQNLHFRLIFTTPSESQGGHRTKGNLQRSACRIFSYPWILSHSKTAKPAMAPTTAPMAKGVAPAAIAFEVDDPPAAPALPVLGPGRVMVAVGTEPSPVGAAVRSFRLIPSLLAMDNSAASSWLTRGAYCEGKAEMSAAKLVAVGWNSSREARRAVSVSRAWK
jgi:hypothetical protein